MAVVVCYPRRHSPRSGCHRASEAQNGPAQWKASTGPSARKQRGGLGLREVRVVPRAVILARLLQISVRVAEGARAPGDLGPPGAARIPDRPGCFRVVSDFSEFCVLGHLTSCKAFDNKTMLSNDADPRLTTNTSLASTQLVKTTLESYILGASLPLQVTPKLQRKSEPP